MSKDKSTFSSFEKDQELFNNWREFLQKKPDHLLNEQKTGTTSKDTPVEYIEMEPMHITAKPPKEKGLGGLGSIDTGIDPGRDSPPPRRTRPVARAGPPPAASTRPRTVPETGAETAVRMRQTGVVKVSQRAKLADLKKQHAAGNIPTAKYKRMEKDLKVQGRMQMRPPTDILKFKPGIERRLPPGGYKPKPGTRPPSEKGKNVLTDNYGIEWNMDDHGYTTGKSPLPDPKTAKKAGLIDANDRLTKQGRYEVDKWQRAQRPKPEFKPKPGSIKLRGLSPKEQALTAAEEAVEAAVTAAEEATRKKTSPAMKKHREKMRKIRKAGPPTKVPPPTKKGKSYEDLKGKKKRKEQSPTSPKQQRTAVAENVDKATRANEGLDLNFIIQEVYKRLTK